jgi:D-lactate dehydrogenase (cytochrome)
MSNLPRPSLSFCRDESRFTGWAEAFSAPKSRQELLDVVGESLANGQPITAQGSRTGLCGSGVPLGGLLLSMSQLDQPVSLREGQSGPDCAFELIVQPGYSLASLKLDLWRRKFSCASIDPALMESFRAQSLFWPPDPGENSATLGGIFSTNAQGPSGFRYGPALGHIKALTIVLSDGCEYEISRGEEYFNGHNLKLPTGTVVNLDPFHLGLKPSADLIEVFGGSEGMYGIITSLTLVLSPRPNADWGLVFFFESEKIASLFIEQVLSDPPHSVVSLDFLDQASLHEVSKLKKIAAKLRDIPEPPGGAACCAIMELHSPDPGLIEEDALKLSQICQDSGGDVDQSWALADAEVDKMRTFRHAVPEALGGRLDQLRTAGLSLIKLAFDATLSGLPFSQALSQYRSDLEKAALTAAVFGHAPQNHLHINILAKDLSDYNKGLELFGRWLERSKQTGGELFSEHGVGKIKGGLFLDHERPERIAALKILKKALDPNCLFNPQNYAVNPVPELGQNHG